MKKIAVYPGTFDPITLGHMDVIEKSSAIFDKVVVGLLRNAAKRPIFSEEERLMMVEETIAAAGLTNVFAKRFNGAAVDFAVQEKAIVLVRGERLVTESEQELAFSFNNYVLNKEIILVYFKSTQEHIHISSSAVREVISLNKFDMLPRYVPSTVLEYINRRK